MKQHYFQYNGRFLQPDKGIAMGSPISSTLAEVYLQYIEETYVTDDDLTRSKHVGVF